MGRMAIIIVLSLVFSSAIITYSINISKTSTVENISGFQRYAIARNISHTGVNMILHTLDKNDTSYVNPLQLGQKIWLVKNYESGICSVSAQLKNVSTLDTVDITSKGLILDTSKSMTLRLKRYPVPFPIIGEAVGLRVKNVNFNMSGNPHIDGRDHDINGNLASDSLDKPGVGVLQSTDSTTVAGYGNKIDGTQDVKIDTSMSDPSLFVNDYITAADRVFTAGTYGSNMTWGSVLAPQIIYADGSSGDVKFNGTINGYGILVVKGDLVISGNFTFTGLVIVYNDASIQKDTLSLSTGTPDIIGGALMAGANGSEFQMKGNPSIVYSSAALKMAQFINKLQVYRVLKWYE